MVEGVQQGLAAILIPLMPLVDEERLEWLVAELIIWLPPCPL